MPERRFTAACLQMRSGRDPGANRDAAVAGVREAAKSGAHYVQTPEMTSLVERSRGATAVLASTQPFASAVVTGARAPVVVAGQVAAPSLAPLGIVALALGIALTIAGPAARIVLGVVLVLLGATAGQALLGSSFRLGAARGRPIDSDLAALVTATSHPSAILRAPDDAAREAMRAEFRRDLAFVSSAL